MVPEQVEACRLLCESVEGEATEAERALSEDWCLDDWFPGEDLSEFEKRGFLFIDLLAEKDEATTERVKTLLSLSDDDMTARDRYEQMDRDLFGRAPEQHVWKRWSDEKKATYQAGRKAQCVLLADGFRVLVRARMTAERKRLKATIARHKRHRAKYGDSSS